MATITTKEWADQSVTTVQLAAGETSPVIPISCHTTIVVLTPGGGGSMSASASWSAIEDIQAGFGNWNVWDAGTVTAPTTDVLLSAAAIKVTATGQPGVAEIRQ